MEIGNSGSSSKKDSKRNNCVALLRESGVELDVFDAKGVRLISIIITTIFKSSQILTKRTAYFI